MTVVPKRWNRDEYYRLAEHGFFEGQRVELIHGEIVMMTPQNRPHSMAVTRLTTRLVREYSDSHYVRVQLPMDLGDSQPEPDFVVAAIAEVDACEVHPTRAELVIEVSDSSLAFDRATKATLYAAAGVQEYWIMNLREERLEVHREPRADATGDSFYAEREIFTRQDSVKFPATGTLFAWGEVLA